MDNNRIRVRLKSTGETGTVSKEQFDPNTFDMLQAEENKIEGLKASHNYQDDVKLDANGNPVFRNVEDIRKKNIAEQEDKGNIQNPTTYKKLGDIFSAPGNKFNEGLSKLSDNWIAGLADIITGIGQTPGSILGLSSEGYKNLPGGESLSKLIDLPGKAGEAGYDATKSLAYKMSEMMDKLGVHPDMQHKLLFGILGKVMADQTPEQQKQTMESFDNLGKMFSQYEGYMALPGLKQGLKDIPVEIGGKIARGLTKETTPASYEMKAQDMPYQDKADQFIELANKGIEGDYSPTKSGLSKFTKDLKSIKDAFDSAVKDTPEGQTVDFNKLKGTWKRLVRKSYDVNDVTGRLTKTTTTDTKMDAIKEQMAKYNKVADQFPNRQVPLKMANRLKTELYEQVADKYGESAGFQKEMYKSIAHDIRDGILERNPQLRELGLNEKTMIDFEPIIQKSVQVNLARHKIRTGTIWRAIATASGTGIASQSLSTGLEFGVGEALAEAVYFDPAFQHKLAVVIDKARKTGLSESKALAAGKTITLQPPLTAFGKNTGGLFGGSTKDTPPDGASPTGSTPTGDSPAGSFKELFDKEKQDIGKTAPPDATIIKQLSEAKSGSPSMLDINKLGNREILKPQGQMPEFTQTSTDAMQRHLDQLKSISPKYKPTLTQLKSFSNINTPEGSLEAEISGLELYKKTPQDIINRFNQYKEIKDASVNEISRIEKITDESTRHKEYSNNNAIVHKAQMLQEELSIALTGDKNIVLDPKEIESRVNKLKSGRTHTEKGSSNAK